MMQQPDILVRYRRAEKLEQNTFINSLVLNATVYPQWLDDDRFRYQRELPDGKREYGLMNAKTGTKDIFAGRVFHGFRFLFKDQHPE